MHEMFFCFVNSMTDCQLVPFSQNFDFKVKRDRRNNSYVVYECCVYEFCRLCKPILNEASKIDRNQNSCVKSLYVD